MVFLIVAIMVTALALMGTATIALLQQNLVRQVDEQLAASAAQLANSISSADIGRYDSTIPSNYYIRRDTLAQPGLVFLTAETERMAGTPIIGDLLSDPNIPTGASGITLPVTVHSTMPGSKWRAVAVPMYWQITAESAGSVTVALPINSVSDTVSTVITFFLLVSAIIVGTGGVAGYFLVRRSLRPLKQIEEVAGKIARGELSERLADYPAETEVGSLTLSLNTMLAQIEGAFRERDATERKIQQFVSDASHELRTPLAAIRGYGELYRLGAVPPEDVGDVMARIESESTRMGSLVVNLLTLARIDENRPLILEDVNLTELALSLKSDLEALDRERPVQLLGLTEQRPPANLTVHADRDQLTQVLVNLVGNIHRYTPEASPVELRVGIRGGWAVIVITDHGPGIPSGEHDRIFERFYRTDQSRARTSGGSGLGLSIVAGIITAHGGTVSPSTTPGGGLTITVQLPLDPPKVPGTDNPGTIEGSPRFQ